MTSAPPPKRRGWIDALVATALRWNDRLSRPLGGSPQPRPIARRPGTPVAPAAAGGRRGRRRGFEEAAENDGARRRAP